MRVVYFSQAYGPHDHRFLQALAAAGQDVHYLRLDHASQPLESRPLPHGVQSMRVWNQSGGIRWWQIPGASRRLRRALDELAPDLVHAGPVQGPALLTALAGFHPLLSMSWGSDLLWHARAGPGRWAARFALRRSDALACDCQAVRRRAQALGAAAERIVVFPWGVDLGHFSPGPSELRAELGWDQAYVVLSARSWQPLLGVDLLLEGFLQATEALPELRLLMLGTGPLERTLRGRIAAAGMGRRVHMAGLVDSDRLPGYYRAADLYVSASHSDGSSISLLEAMACGLPALVSDIPGNREWIKHEINGWLFPDGDAVALGRALQEAAHSPIRGRHFGDRNRAIAEQRADWSCNFPKLLEAYELASKHARSEP